ncbi:hypothetical protein CPB84DRAFT_986273 [Gymnopilus junonius]|uniref:Uncharacterized protein n=1 Tax=Gymnopilus junonius TaxID=109634 RepID=A0A9P5NPJ1_GYMJU|nr:hypothetical protein CPB84DRAFT_986273 [Gymnopilus junonius]
MQDVLNLHIILHFQSFNMKSFRYGFATYMLGKVSPAHLKYLMGHQPGSNLAKTVYQVPDRQVDVSAIRFNAQEDTTLSEHHSSVSWKKASTDTLDVDLEQLIKNGGNLKELIETFKVAEARVSAKYGCSSKEVPEKAEKDVIVEEASEASLDVLVGYAEASSNISPAVSSRPSSRMSTTSDSRSRSASVSSDMSIVSVVEDSAIDPVLLQATSPPAASSADELAALPCPELDALISEQLGKLSLSHPFQEAILADNNNPRYLFFAHLLAMMKSDDLQNNGICPFCFSDETLDEALQVRCWAEKFSYHYWKCEDRNTKDHWRCPVCADMVKCASKGPDKETVLADLDIHRNACYQAALVEMKLVNVDEPDQQEQREDETEVEKDGEDEQQDEEEQYEESQDSKGKACVDNNVTQHQQRRVWPRLQKAVRSDQARQRCPCASSHLLPNLFLQARGNQKTQIPASG